MATLSQPAFRDRRVLAASALTGNKVRNPQGEHLGKIEELMIDMATGQVAYAVLSFGGFLGFAGKLFAIPWRALAVDNTNHEFILEVNRERLETAPGFDKDNWPDMADPSWSANIAEYYGTPPPGAGDSFDDESRERALREHGYSE